MAALAPDERGAMRALLAAHFDGVTPASFDADLDEKDAAVLLYDGDRLGGFSTLLRIETAHDGRPVTAFFSGDTVVDAAARGAALLPRLWSQHVFAEARRQPERETVWFLLSSGYKTYRFLPTFFRRFTPAPAGAGAADAPLLAALAAARYGDRYDAATGVVRLAHATPLRDGVADLSAHRLADPHVAFFAAANPGWPAGDELACLTRVHPDNLTQAGRRMVGPDLARPYDP